MFSKPIHHMACTVCGSPQNEELGELRILRDRSDWTGLLFSRGPFHRYCAYREKYYIAEIFETQPTNTIELLFRLITQRELPESRGRVIVWFFRVLAFVGSFSALIIGWLFLFRAFKFYIIGIILLDFSLSAIAVLFLLVFDPWSQDGVLKGGSEEETAIKRFVRPFFWTPPEFRELVKDFFSLETFEDERSIVFVRKLFSLLIFSTLLFSRVGSLIVPAGFILFVAYLSVVYLFRFLAQVLFFPLISLTFWILIGLFIKDALFGNFDESSTHKLFTILRKVIFYRFIVVPLRFLYHSLALGSTGISNIECFDMTWEGELVFDDLPASYYLIGAILTVLYARVVYVFQPRWLFEATRWVLDWQIRFLVLLPVIVLASIGYVFIPDSMGLVRVAWERVYVPESYAFKPIGIAINLIGPIVLYGMLMVAYRRAYRYIVSFMEMPEDIHLQAMREVLDEEEIKESTVVQKGEKVSKRQGIYSFFARFKGETEVSRVCQICKRGVNKGVMCPFCKSLYHENHLQQYLTYRNSKVCPLCRKEIKHLEPYSSK